MKNDQFLKNQRLLPSRREFVKGTIGVAAYAAIAGPVGIAHAAAATGDYKIDFAPLANANPYVNSNLKSIDSLPVKITSGALSPSGGSGSQFGLRRYRFNGTMVSGRTIRSKVQVGNAAGSDLIYAGILAADGSGYILKINQRSVAIMLVNASGTTTGLISTTVSSAARGDIFTLELNPMTHILTAYLNGVAISGMSIANSTYVTGLAFAFAFDAQNVNASTILSFAGDGGNVAVSYIPWVMADFGNLTTNAAVSATGVRSGNFPNVYATFNGGYGASRSTTHVYPGKSTSLQLSIPMGSDGDPAGGDTGVGKGLFGLVVGFPTALGAGSIVHAQVRIYFPTGFSFHSPTSSVKFLRFRTADTSDANQGYNDLYLNDTSSGTWGNNGNGGSYHGALTDGHLHYVGEFGRTDNIWTTGSASKGVWEEFEFETKLGAGTSGSVKIWKKISGVWKLILSLNNIATLNHSTHLCTAMLLHTYWNGNAPQTQADYVDRIVIENNLNKLTQTDALGNKIIGSSI